MSVIYDLKNNEVTQPFKERMPKDFTGVERRSCNNEDVVYNDSLIYAVIKERSNCCSTF